MGTMHKEIVVRKKFPIVLTSFFLIVLSLFFVQAIKDFSIGSFRVGGAVSLLVPIIVSAFLIYEVLKCKIKYKLFIIADQVIIHKIKGSSDRVVENIKIKNIDFIGKSCDFVEKLEIVSTKKYVCSMFNASRYCCVYRDGNVKKKFYFEASSNMIEKIKFIQERKLAS